MKKLTTLVITSLLLFTTFSNIANAQDIAYYSGDIPSHDRDESIRNFNLFLQAGYKYDSKITPLSSTTTSRIGRVLLNKSNGMTTSSTGFVIGSHTVLTNRHVIDHNNKEVIRPSKVKFKLPYKGLEKTITITKINAMSKDDVAVLTTKEDLSKYVKPLVMATPYQVSNLKPFSPISSIGYPSGMSKSHVTGRMTGYNLNGRRLDYSMFAIGGQSGSPVFYKDKVIAIQTSYYYNYNKRPYKSDYSMQGMLLTKNVQAYIKKYLK